MLPFLLACESAISTALRHMSKHRRASPETAATCKQGVGGGGALHEPKTINFDRGSGEGDLADNFFSPR